MWLHSLPSLKGPAGPTQTYLDQHPLGTLTTWTVTAAGQGGSVFIVADDSLPRQQYEKPRQSPSTAGVLSATTGHQLPTHAPL
ncbi:hypothetical protein MLD38_040558 [Melastoma candidum]|nr:hypothetical protein MLD38_040558 [Melastoma candidum]